MARPCRREAGAVGYNPDMSDHTEKDETGENSGALGHLDDEAEAAEPSSDEAGGPAAAGEYDPAEGSPSSGPHPTGEHPGA